VVSDVPDDPVDVTMDAWATGVVTAMARAVVVVVVSVMARAVVVVVVAVMHGAVVASAVVGDGHSVVAVDGSTAGVISEKNPACVGGASAGCVSAAVGVA